jgi:hypothetical protein
MLEWYYPLPQRLRHGARRVGCLVRAAQTHACHPGLLSTWQEHCVVLIAYAVLTRPSLPAIYDIFL